MNLKISFRHLEHTDAIDQKIREKISRLAEKYLGPEAKVEWTSWVEHNDHITTLHTYDRGKEYFARAHADSLYKTIDLVVQKMTNQMLHAKRC